MTTHEIFTIFVIVGVVVFFYIVLRITEAQDKRDREQRKDAAAK